VSPRSLFVGTCNEWLAESLLYDLSFSTERCPFPPHFGIDSQVLTTQRQMIDVCVYETNLGCPLLPAAQLKLDTSEWKKYMRARVVSTTVSFRETIDAGSTATTTRLREK
jgi:hypothetical protein